MGRGEKREDGGTSLGPSLIGEGYCYTRIRVAFRLIHPVMDCIKDNNGGNNFKIPHSGIRKQMRSEGWDI